MTPWVDDPVSGARFYVPDEGEVPNPGATGGGAGYDPGDTFGPEQGFVEPDGPGWNEPGGANYVPPAPPLGVGIGAGAGKPTYSAGAGMAWQYDQSQGRWVAVPYERTRPFGGEGLVWDDISKSWKSPGLGGIAAPGLGGGVTNANPFGGSAPVTGTGTAYPAPMPGGASGHSPAPGNFGLYGSRLVVEPVAGQSELAVLNMLRYHRGAQGWSVSQLQEALQNPTFIEMIANTLRVDVGTVQNVTNKVLSTGISGLLMMLTGNFPLAAMGYFASDRVLGQDAGVAFRGWMAGQPVVDGQLVLPIGVPIPDGLPNEIFNDFRFVCFDRLTSRWWPTDEVKPLSYQSNEFRWFVLDRVDGKVYQANWIKKPTIYI